MYVPSSCIVILEPVAVVTLSILTGFMHSCNVIRIYETDKEAHINL